MRSRHLFQRVAFVAVACTSQACVAAPACTVAFDALDAARTRGDWFAALAEVERGLACAPGDRALLRQRVRLLGDIGSNDTAWRQASAVPGLLDGEDFERLTSKRLARLIGWSSVGRDEAARRVAALQALRASDTYLAQVAGKDRQAALRTRLDRLLLLNRLGRHQQVADEQALLRRENVAVPPYLVGTVSDSLLALRRPDEAAALLAPRLEDSAAGAPLQVTHAFAELEMERGLQAQADLRRYAARQPPYPWDREHRARQRNWARYDADLARIQIATYAGDMPAAQAELEAMLAIAPANGTLHAALGQTYLMRGWPRRALDRFHIAALYAPDDPQPAIGEVEALLALRRDHDAVPLHARLLAQYPGNSRVAQLDRTWARHRGWQGQLTAARGASHGAGADNDPLGSRDADYAVSLLSPLIAHRWRMRAGTTGHQADLRDGRVIRRDAAVGLQYVQGALEASLDRRWAGHAVPGDAGLDLRVSWELDDRWSLAGQFQRNTEDASLQVLQAGITADRQEAAVRYQHDERHGLRLSLGRLAYTDGNRRHSVLAHYAQQLTQADHWWVDAEGSAYASRASLHDAPYFNPARDTSLTLGVRLAQRPWRHYERHFLHRLALSVGRYWQQGYRAAWVPGVRYEHEWRLAPGRSLRYGASWAQPVYDGARERRVGLDAGFYWEQ